MGHVSYTSFSTEFRYDWRMNTAGKIEIDRLNYLNLPLYEYRRILNAHNQLNTADLTWYFSI
jgi:hypothetical protein